MGLLNRALGGVRKFLLTHKMRSAAIRQEESLRELNSWDMNRPVLRGPERERYLMPEPGQTLVEQIRTIRQMRITK